MANDTKPIAEMQQEVRRLCAEKNVLFLAHNYQRPEVQDTAELVGDSLALSIAASRSDAEIILFAGVHFMAESAKILSPDKKVLMPRIDAGCPMADMADAEAVRARKAEHPDAAVVTYVNSTAGVKAETDVCCTSANAVRVVESIPAERPILFVPDQSLADYVAEQTGRDNIILWPGFCPTHHRILAEHVEARRRQCPDAEVLVHPECTRDVRHMADFIGSTSQIIRHVTESPKQTFIIGTEFGVCHTIRKANPEKMIIQARR